VESQEAVELIRPAIDGSGDIWVDCGAGTGTFTLALATLLGSSARIVAIDNDARAIAGLRRSLSSSTRAGARIEPVKGDFQDLETVAELADDSLDGALFANALHFVADPARVFTQVARLLHGEGRIVVVEYDRRPASRWVPYPVPIDRLNRLASQTGFNVPTIVGERPSDYGGAMYCAVLTR
jgi:ubiquinone/menaquinone biosynthesis C-methylase UbiE